MTTRPPERTATPEAVDATTEQGECHRIVRAGVDDSFGATSISTVAPVGPNAVTLADAGKLRDYPSMC
jgi:hypothetical protein